MGTVTAGTDITVTAISAPADMPLPDGVRPRSAWEPAQTRCLHVTYMPLTRTACPVSWSLLRTTSLTHDRSGRVGPVSGIKLRLCSGTSGRSDRFPRPNVKRSTGHTHTHTHRHTHRQRTTPPTPTHTHTTRTTPQTPNKHLIV